MYRYIKQTSFIFLKHIDSVLLTIMVMMSFSSLLFLHIKLNSFSSFFFRAMYVVLFIWPFLKFVSFKKYQANLQFEKKQFVTSFVLLVITVFLSFLSLLITTLKSGATVSVNYFSNFFSFIALCVIVFIATFGNFKKTDLLVPVFLSVLLSSILIITFLLGYSRKWAGLHSYSLLTLNFSNPNLAGIVTSTLFFVNFYGFFLVKSKIVKVYILILNIVLLILFYLTSARMPIVSFVISLILTLILYLDDKRKFYKYFIIFILGIPVVFVSIYLLFMIIAYPEGVLSYSGITDGKDIFSRFSIWVNTLSAMSKDFTTITFGNYSSFNGNLHNSIITLMGCYGALSSISFLIYLFYNIRSLLGNKPFISISQYFGALFLFFFYLIGIGEATPVLTSNGMYIFFALGIIMMKCPASKSPFREYENVKISKGTSKVIIISNVYNFGSIGKIIRDCHNDNVVNNFDSYVIYGRGISTNDLNVVSIEYWAEVFISKIFRRIFHSQTIGCYYMTSEIIKAIDDIKPNLVHIVSVNDDYLNFYRLYKYLYKNNIKSVYTHHSEYMYLGLCGGHSYNCNKFINDKCENCEIKPRKASKKTFVKKLRSVELLSSKKLLISTSVSPWLHYRVKESYIFRDICDYIVVNGSRIYKEKIVFTKKDFISKYGLDPYCKLVLYVTPSLSNKTKKAFDVFEIASRNKNIHFIVLSLNRDSYNYSFSNVTIIYGTTDDAVLASYYRLSDLTLLTGTKETFSMPVIESLLSGTPVVGYKCGGPESIGIPNYSSFVENGNIILLEKKMKEFLYTKFDKNKISEDSIKIFSSEIMAKNYREVYCNACPTIIEGGDCDENIDNK